MRSCRQLRTSQNSSIVPKPPGSATNASLRSSISALRSCMVVDDVQLGETLVSDLGARERLRNDADHLAAAPSAASATIPINPMPPPP